MVATARCGAAVVFMLAALLLGLPPAFAQDAAAIKLFKMITAKDEVVIGVADQELRSLGPRPDIDNLAERLVSAGQISAWQYAVKKAADGSLVQAPLKRIAVFRNDTLRLEPYATPLQIIPPTKQ
jgi:hypothetical protein